ncbi:RNase HII [Luteimonas cucumeris]|uniref:Ribonuclease HII n=1 Tax=Luteimonas cucumeris TaxID=985012 RepID=A0A562LBK0_9GAMM|nr:RNase HII [Luteimonas cucumeris]
MSPTSSDSRFPIPDSRPLVAGIDEAGRGPLAGPVVVAAVVFDPGKPRINGLDDSKQLNASRREQLYARIVERALAWHVVFVDADEIDRINIFQATMLGMRLALEGVAHVAHVARIDGNHLPPRLPCPAEAWIGGDARDRSIMAASILAKVTRDRFMVELHDRHPEYGFDGHKGYSTPTHLAALRTHGPCAQHRRSFAPVREALADPPLQALLPV